MTKSLESRPWGAAFILETTELPRKVPLWIHWNINIAFGEDRQLDCGGRCAVGDDKELNFVSEIQEKRLLRFISVWALFMINVMDGGGKYIIEAHMNRCLVEVFK